MCFFCSARALDCCRFPKKKLISGGKIFPAMFRFCLFFPSPSLTFFLNLFFGHPQSAGGGGGSPFGDIRGERVKIGPFYCFVALTNFSRNCQMFF